MNIYEKSCSMKQEAIDAIEIFLNNHLEKKVVIGVVIIGSAAGDSFIPGKSDIDIVVVTDNGPLLRGKQHIGDIFSTLIDFIIGTATDIAHNYIYGDGRAFSWLFTNSLIYKDDMDCTVRNLVNNLASQHSYLPSFGKIEPAWRLGLTNQCNFGCFFCHGEGLVNEDFQRPNFEKLYNLILYGITHGCRDFTLTGGEPLLYNKEIAKLLRKLSHHPARPDITIVTNGFLLTEDLIAAAKSYGNIKFNISFHTTDKDTFQHIIRRQNNEFARVSENITRISGSGLKFSLNYVLLRNLNDASEQIEAILEYAKEVGAYAIKFLELLVTDKLIGFYDQYCDVRYIENLLSGRLTLVREILRRREYLLQASNLRIYIQQCRCRLGCSKCSEGMDRIITPDIHYEPCFTENKKTYPLSTESLAEIFHEGDKIISIMSRQYGNRSPLLVCDPNFSETKEEYFYLTNMSEEKLTEQFLLADWKLERINMVKETYYLPHLVEHDWENCNIVYKSYINHDFPGKHKQFTALMKYTTTSCGSYCTKTHFSVPEGPQEFNDEQLQEHILRTNMKKWISLQWKFQHFSTEKQRVSIGKCSNPDIVIICSANQPLEKYVLEKYQLRTLQLPLIKYIASLDQSQL